MDNLEKRSFEQYSNTDDLPDFESIKDVEFAGEMYDDFRDAEPEINTEPKESKEKKDALIEEALFQLRQPFEADEKVRIENTDRRCELQTQIDSRNEALEALTEKRAQLEEEKATIVDQSAARSRKFLSRVRSRIGIADKTIIDFNRKKIDIETQLAHITEDSYDLSKQNEDDKKSILAVEERNNYAEKIKPFSPEEKRRFLKPEALSELSMAEYIALWRRLNPFYASHVTRQGVRDHYDTFFHSAGMSEYSAGFTEMLKSNKTIQTPAEVNFGIAEGFDEKDVEKTIDKYADANEGDFQELVASGMSPEEAAKEYVMSLPMNRTLASAEPWSDAQAIHFARNTALEEIYGAEKGNEVFYVFPIDVIASQNRFGGHIGRDFASAQVVGERKWNDLFVWPESGHIPLDAGIVFLPKSVEVSPETGSVYETVESVGPNGETVREPFLDEEIVMKLTDAIEKLESEGIFDPENPQIYRILQQGDTLEEFKTRLVEEFGIEEETVEGILHCRDSLLRSKKSFSEDLLFKKLAENDGINVDELSGDEQFRLSLRYFMETGAIGFKKAENPVSAEAYWTRYFEEHPEQHPKHVVFYDGDPSKAVSDFMEENGIGKRCYGDNVLSDTSPNMSGPGDTHETDGKWLGYDDNLLIDPGNDEKMQSEHARFNNIAIQYTAKKIREKRGESSQN